MTDATIANRTPVLAFSARERFEFRQWNAAQGQQGRGGGRRYLTTSDLFLREMILRYPQQFRVEESRASVPCVPVEAWGALDLAGKRLLFLLPSQALGSNVATLLAIEALVDRWKPAEIAVFCAKSAADIYGAARRIRVYPFWIGEDELRRYDHVFDLGQIEARRDIEIWPVDMEGEILAAFAAEPSRRYPAEPRPLPRRERLRIGIFPLGSSPLRTLPIAVTRALAASLAGEGELKLFLNKAQTQGKLYAADLAADPLPGVEVVEGFPSIAGLMRAIERSDYAVFADSGPAHIAKLFRTPGVGIYTSAPASVLQGRFRNLEPWHAPFEGPHCRAPCGLAKVRAAADGRLGCMGSLGLDLAALPSVAKGANAAAVEELMLRAPVPCVAALAADHTALVEFVRADLAGRRSQG